jgi:sterol desaturase/sphingolipid hydroxylase (fatty acid hydroxylase superfamily)
MTQATAVPGTLPYDPGLVLLALAPVFLLSIALEAWYWRRRNPAIYSFRDTLSNAALALMHQASDAFFLWLMVRTIYTWLYERGLQAMPLSAWGFVLLLLLQDFLYYWFHRASHRIRFMWASHVVHHSSERLNLSTAFRQSLTYPISGMWVFWLPLAWLGFPPDWVILAVGLNLAFQFFVHTQLFARDSKWMNALGWIVNTPSIHRVHHARNPQYIDRNYAGVLTVWDRLFGSYVPEREPPDYGILRQIRTLNPIVLTFHEWRDMLRDAWASRSLLPIVKPPEWVAPRLDEPPAALDARSMDR